MSRQGPSPAALAWLGALGALLVSSLLLAVYAGWAKWRELASEPSTRPPAAASSASSAGAQGSGAPAEGRPGAAGAAAAGVAAPANGKRSAARLEPKKIPSDAAARGSARGRGPLEAGPETARGSARPRLAPRRIPADEAARRLAPLGAKLDRDHFQFAVARGELEQVRLFLEAGFSPNQRMANEDFSLFYLTLIGLHDAKQEEAATLMLDYGADLEVRAPSGITPLMIAAIDCKPRFAEALIERGAQLQARDPQGTTALVWAQRASCASVADVLEKRGAR